MTIFKGVYEFSLPLEIVRAGRAHLSLLRRRENVSTPNEYHGRYFNVRGTLHRYGFFLYYGLTIPACSMPGVTPSTT